MPATTPTSPAATPAALSAALRILADGHTNRVDVTTGRRQEIHADCPTDGAPASVRRVTRAQGGAITEVTLRCPRCYGDFVAAQDKLYLS